MKMKIHPYFIGLLLLSLILPSPRSFGQGGGSGQAGGQKETPGNWPKEIVTAGGKILIYQPQSDSMVGNKLYSRSAVSVTKTGSDPVFGAIWATSTLGTDRESGRIELTSVKILNVRFPNQEQIDPARIKQFKDLLGTEIPKWQLTATMEDLLASLKESKATIRQAEDLNNDPPEIIFSKKPALLVTFDGEPVFKPVDNSGLQRAINTPFLVLQDTKGKQYYLYGGDFWYKTDNVVKGTWNPTKTPSAAVKQYQSELDKSQKNKSPAAPTTAEEGKKTSQKPSSPQVIFVRTRPAELIQSDGEPNFAPIQGTQLLYVTNSDDDIFMTIDQQKYFILLAGRWYTSSSLNGPWLYTASDKLPEDFARIPEGSEKDIVLASVAGTEAARDAILDAQIPQTAAVDRKTATCTVTYDGEPKYEQIKGTMLYRAVNTTSTVILSDKTYYVCENAVWFTGFSPTGPWTVATSIPAEIQKIPPEDPAYNVKYVYIYDVQPEVVYMGYLPGYVGCYVYGPTIVYGTGWPYPAWYGPYYYPRPVTWGFSMHYNPWTGWSMGFGVSVGCFSFSFGMGYPGGWWGPPIYRPPVFVPYNHYYGNRPMAVRNTTINVNNTNINRSNFNQSNIYNNRTGTRPSTQPAARNDRVQAGTQPATRDNKAAAGGPQNRGDIAGQAQRAQNTQNNVYTDKAGNVYRKEGSEWQRNDGKSWQPADNRSATQPMSQPQAQPSSRQSSSFDQQSMDRQSQYRDRGTRMNTNRSTYNRSAGSYGGGGSMRSGRK